MSQPPTYNRFQNFANWAAANPGDIYIGSDFDGEFNRIKATLDATLTNLALIQRDDGALASGSVGRDQLDASVAAGVNTPTSWTTGVAYTVRDSVVVGTAWYWAKVAHTSGSVFATDLAAGKWEQIFDFSSLPTSVPSDGSVTTAKLANLAVTAGKIANNTITASQIANATITATQIANATITATQLANNAVGTSQIAALAVTTAKIAASAVTSTELASSAVTTAKITDANVTAAKESDDDYSDIASAATCAIGGVASRHVRITGTTGITSFGTIAAGRRRRCKMAGALTITHNGTSLVCPGSANITTAAGDTFDAISRGSGNWEIQNYQKADGSALVTAPTATLPVGMISPYGGSSAPSGWALCDGSAQLRSGGSYDALFAVIGTTYGAGNGSTTFNLPDLRGRIPAGKDDMGGSAASRLTSTGLGVSGATLGNAGGAETHTLTTGEMPTHSHNITITQIGAAGTSRPPALVNASATNTYATETAGSGTAHKNVQPSLIVNYIIKL